ncbi:MAG: hypothetical protein ACHQCF_08585 [Solirubrobacterales bacterium]
MALGRGIAAAACVGALALLALGCGAQERPNDPRPSPPTRLSVAISNEAVTVTPSRIGMGPERSQLIQQNRKQPQPPIRTKEPLNVVFVTANLTRTNSKLEIHGPKEATSGLLAADGKGTFLAGLPTGTYTVSAAGIPRAKPARLFVGPYRASSQNDVLLP